MEGRRRPGKVPVEGGTVWDEDKVDSTTTIG